jgi:hypothetical protein
MEKYVVKEISKNLKWNEKIIVRVFRKLFFKIYNEQRMEIINKLL